MTQPLRPVGMSLEVELADERRIAPDHDHCEEIRDHRNIDQRENAEHEERFARFAQVVDHFPEFHNEFVRVQ